MVVAIVIAVIGCFTPAGHQAAGAITDVISGDVIAAQQGFALCSNALCSTYTNFLTSSLFSLPSGVTAETINGITTYNLRNSSLVAATTTPCAFQNPSATATSSIAEITFQVTTGTTTAGTLTFATSTTAFATSSPFFTTTAGYIAANGQQTVTWDPGPNNNLVAPNGWVVTGIAGGTINGTTYGGSCHAVLRSTS